jgi:hypothetical protein
MVLRYALERETPQKHAFVWIAKKPVGGIGKTAEVAGLSFSDPRKGESRMGRSIGFSASMRFCTRRWVGCPQKNWRSSMLGDFHGVLRWLRPGAV